MQINDHGFTKFTKEASLIAITDIVLRLKGVILLPLLTKLLGVQNYGIWTQLMVTVNLTIPLVLLGLSSAIVRFLAGEKDKNVIRDGILSSLTAVLFAGILLSLILFGISNLLAAKIFADPRASHLIKISLLLIIFTSLNLLLFSYLRSSRQIARYSKLIIIQTSLELAAIAYSIFAGYAVIGAVIALIIVQGVILLINLYLITKELGIGLPTFSNFKSYLAFGLPLIPTPFLYWILYSSDHYFIGYFHGISPVGIYSAACTIASVIIALSNPIHFVLYPAISKLWEEGKLEEVKINLKYAFKYTVIIGIPAVFGVSMLAQRLLRIFTTPEYISANLVVPLISSSLLVLQFSGLAQYILMLAKRTKAIATLLAIAAGLNIMLNILLIPPLGILGAAIATAICYIALGISLHLASTKNLVFELDLKLTGKAILSSLGVVIFIRLANLNILLSITLGILVYTMTLLALKGLSPKEISFITSLLRPKKKYSPA
jgi:O-antigen/teichoic acid export membrane protein